MLIVLLVHYFVCLRFGDRRIKPYLLTMWLLLQSFYVVYMSKGDM